MGHAGERIRVGLVACVKTKRPVPSAAKDLYDSPLFHGQRRAVESTCDQWFILSARHGLLYPDAVVEPYEETLVRASRRDKRAWAQRVLGQLDEELGDVRGTIVECTRARTTTPTASPQDWTSEAPPWRSRPRG